MNSLSLTLCLYRAFFLGHRLTKDVNMGHNKLLSQLTYMAVFPVKMA